jgi:hypothetical protein
MSTVLKSHPATGADYPPAPMKVIDPVIPPAFWPTDCFDVWILCDSIRKKTDENVERENGDAVAFRLADLESLLGTSAYALAEMTARREARRKDILEGLSTTLPPSLQRDYVNSKMGGHLAAYEYCDRLNSGLVHAIDAMRSVLSWLKSERNATA